jgi:flagellin
MAGVLFNVSSMINQSKLRLHNKVFTTANERLATGSRVNSAKDDPHRNYESRNITSEIRNTEKAKQNSTDGAALLQIAEGACSEVQNILQRMRELAVQSANDTLTSTERRYLDIEVSELSKEIDRLSIGTTFNAKQIFGNIGDSFSDEQRDLADWKPHSIAKDADGNYLRAGVLHIGSGSGKADEVKVSIPEISARALGLDTLSITYQAGATSAIDNLDTAISSLGTIRSYMGALVNRMDRQVEDLDSKNINLSDYNSRIKDTDFAKESTALASSQIQIQAAIAMLSQGNSRIGRVLEILG